MLQAIDRLEEPYRTMLRLAEVCRVPRRALATLTLGDFDLFGDAPAILFRTEDGDEVRQPLSAAAVGYLVAYLQGWRSTHESGPGYLFPQPRHPDEPASLAVAKRQLHRAVLGRPPGSER